MSDVPDRAAEPPSVIRIPDTVLMQRVVDEVVFLNLDDNTYYGLEPIGSRMLALLLELPTIEEVVDVLATEYQASSATLNRDVRILIADLESNGLVEVVGAVDEASADEALAADG